MNNALISFAECMQDCRTMEFSPYRVQNSGYQPQYSCPRLRRRGQEVRILPSGNGIFRSTTAMYQSKKGIFRLLIAISNEKMYAIHVCNRNIAMKKGNIAVSERKVEVGNRNCGYKLCKNSK